MGKLIDVLGLPVVMVLFLWLSSDAGVALTPKQQRLQDHCKRFIRCYLEDLNGEISATEEPDSHPDDDSDHSHRSQSR